METLTEINQADAKRRERARLFESLQGDAIRLRANITRLEKDVVAYDCSALKEIVELAANIPASVLTESRTSLGMGVPSGISARVAVQMAAEAGLNFATRHQAESVTALKNAKASLAKVEKELAAL
jgi:hypothetical protein